MKKIGKLFHVITFCLIFLLVFNQVNSVMMAKNSRVKYYEFFSSEENFDVLFMGTSRVINGVVPMQLYHNYGITSYNAGNHSSLMPTTYYTLVNMLNYTTPKVVVLDIGSIYSDEKVYENISYAHTAYDYIPISTEKVIAVNDLFGTLSKKGEMLIPFAKYHTRWKSLTSSDFSSNAEVTGYRGAEPRIRVDESATKPELTNEIDDTYTVGKEYLEKTIQLCQDEGIEVVLTLVPHHVEKDIYKSYNYGYVLAEKYNIAYIDFIAMDDIVDYDFDFYDQGFHLNPSGAKKITDYLGQYLSQSFDLEDHREDVAYEYWDADYEKYVLTNINNLESNREKINEYLMLLSNDDFQCTISISDKIRAEEHPLLFKLIDNISEIDEANVNEVDGRIFYTNIKNTVISNFEMDGDINIVVYRRTTGEEISKARFKVNDYSKIEAF